MKQWLTKNKVGPYSKTKINESHEGNDQWLDRFYDELQGLKADQWIKKQIMDIPSHDLISLYGDTTPENALKDVVKKMFHFAKEGKQTLRERDMYEVGGSQSMSQADFFLDGVEYMANLYLNWTGMYHSEDGEFDLESIKYDVEVTELAKDNGTEYVPITNPEEIKAFAKKLETDPNAREQILDYIDFSKAEETYDDSPPAWLDEKNTKNEQIGVGYASITKPSDPKY